MDTEFFNFWQSDRIVDFIRLWPKNAVFGPPKWTQTQYSWGAEYGIYPIRLPINIGVNFANVRRVKILVEEFNHVGMCNDKI